MNPLQLMIDRFDPRRSAGRLVWRAEDGQTLIEYALILALIALVVFGVLTLLGGHVNSFFNTLSNDL